MSSSRRPGLQPGLQHHRVVDVAHRRAGGLAHHAQRAAELQQQPEHRDLTASTTPCQPQLT
jgi:hypothetical protein